MPTKSDYPPDRLSIYPTDEDRARLHRLHQTYGLKQSTAYRLGLAVLEAHLGGFQHHVDWKRYFVDHAGCMGDYQERLCPQ